MSLIFYILELENLFNTLNPAEEEEVKNDEIREINIEDEPGVSISFIGFVCWYTRTTSKNALPVINTLAV